MLDAKAAENDPNGDALRLVVDLDNGFHDTPDAIYWDPVTRIIRLVQDPNGDPGDLIPEVLHESTSSDPDVGGGGSNNLARYV